jgi:hypothetical protein
MLSCITVPTTTKSRWHVSAPTVCVFVYFVLCGAICQQIHFLLTCFIQQQTENSVPSLSCSLPFIVGGNRSILKLWLPIWTVLFHSPPILSCKHIALIVNAICSCIPHEPWRPFISDTSPMLLSQSQYRYRCMGSQVMFSWISLRILRTEGRGWCSANACGISRTCSVQMSGRIRLHW